MLENEDLEAVFTQLQRGERSAMRRLYAQTSQKVFGVIVLLVTDQARQRTAMLETYTSIWNQRSAWAGPGGDHAAWVLARARLCALRARADELTASKVNGAGTDDSLPFDGGSVYQGNSLTALEHGLLVDAYIAGEGPAALERRYNLQTGQVVAELQRIIRRIGETEK